jgi:hypothetical protein
MDEKDKFYNGESIILLKKRWGTSKGKEIRGDFISGSIDNNYLDFRGVNLNHEIINNFDFRGKIFDYADLDDAKIINGKMRKSHFIKADLTNVKFINCNFEGADLREAKLTLAIFKDCQFVRVKFQGAIVYNTKYLSCDLTNTSFELDDDGVPTSLDNVTFSNCRFWGTRMNNTILRSCHIDAECIFYNIQNNNWDISNTFASGVYVGPSKNEQYFQPFDDDLTLEEYFKHRHAFTKWFSIPKEVRTATIQYMQYFKDFLEQTKALTIDVQSSSKGQKVGFTFSSENLDDLQLISDNLKDYIGYVTGDTQIDYQSANTHLKLSYKALELEILTLKNRVEIKDILINEYKGMLSLTSNRTLAPVISIQNNTNSYSSSIINQQFEEKIDHILQQNKDIEPDLHKFLELLKKSNNDSNIKELKNISKKINQKTSLFKKIIDEIYLLGENIIMGVAGNATWELIKVLAIMM